MSLLNGFGRVAAKYVSGNRELQRRISLANVHALPYSSSKVTAEDLQGLPEKPKKPLTAFFRFMVEIRPELKREHPDCNPRDFMKLVAEKWEVVSDESKRKYVQAYQDDLRAYSAVKAKYNEELTEEHKALLKKVRADRIVDRKNRDLKKKMKDLGRPKKPASPFIMFFNSRATSRGDVPYKDWVSRLGKEWADLPPEMKTAYQRQYSAKTEEYNIQMRAWEEKMIKLGNSDLVRHQTRIESRETQKKIVAGGSVLGTGMNVGPP